MAEGDSEQPMPVMHADKRERDRALWKSAEDVLRSLDEFYLRPPAPPVPARLRGATTDSIRREALSDPAFALTFGQFRLAVLTHEERSARRLEVLRGTARTLIRLRDLAGAERVDPMLQHLADFVQRAWGFDLDLDAGRDWALNVSMRHDLLPPSWRRA